MWENNSRGIAYPEHKKLQYQQKVRPLQAFQIIERQSLTLRATLAPAGKWWVAHLLVASIAGLFASFCNKRQSIWAKDGYIKGISYKTVHTLCLFYVFNQLQGVPLLCKAITRRPILAFQPKRGWGHVGTVLYGVLCIWSGVSWVGRNRSGKAIYPQLKSLQYV